MDGAPPTAIPHELAEQAESLDLLTLGVEEEYLLVDAVEPHGVESVENAFDQLPDDIKGSVQHEYMRSRGAGGSAHHRGRRRSGRRAGHADRGHAALPPDAGTLR
jgi:hypothetical protein